MLNIREDLKTLLKEAPQVKKADIKVIKYITPETLIEASEEDDELEQIAGLGDINKQPKQEQEWVNTGNWDEEEAKRKEDKTIDVEAGNLGFWGGYTFKPLCVEALDNNKCLPLVSVCLQRDFYFDPSKPETNLTFYNGLNYVISFYVDIVESYNSGNLVGKVEKAISDLKETDRLDARGINTIINFFTKKNKTRVLVEKPHAEMLEDLTNLCIAAEIINWERILTYQNSYDADLMTVKDIFKPKSEQSSAVNQEFISNLSDDTLNVLYGIGKKRGVSGGNNKKNPFGEFLSSFAWGRRGHLIERRLSEAFGVQGDLGIGGDNEKFILNMLISYLINILKNNNQVNAGTIIKLANLLSIKDAAKLGQGATSKDITSMDSPERTNLDASPEAEDLDNPDYQSALADSSGSDSVLGVEGVKKPEDELLASGENLHAAEDFREYVEKVKLENNWTLKNNLAFLSNALKTADSADGLSAILSKIFIALPATVLGVSYSSPAVLNNKIQEVNLLDKCKDMALTSKFITFLSELAFLIAKSDKTKIKQENKSYIKTALLEMANFFSNVGLTSVEAEELIAALPKTLQETKASTSVFASRSEEGFKIVKASKEIKRINDTYNAISSKAPVFSHLSPSEFGIIPPEGLSEDSYLQKFLGINIIPTVTPGIVGIVGPQATKLTRVKTADLELLWDVYRTAIKEILDPGINIASWGLLIPTLLSDRPSDPEASYGILYSTPEVPPGTTVGEKTIKPLFLAPGEFTPFRTSILAAVDSRKQRFLAAKTLTEIKQVLKEILDVFGKKKQLRYFKSPGTQTIDDRKKCPLYKLVDPARAIGEYLINIEKNHAFPVGGGGTTTNPLEDLVANIIVTNNKATNASVIYDSSLSLFEAEEPTQEESKAYELALCYVIINTHIRARLLLNLTRIIELLQDILVLLREVILQLETVLTEKLSEDNIGAIEDFFSDLAKIIISVLSEREDTSFSGIKGKIAKLVKPINEPFIPSELARKQTSALKGLGKTSKLWFGED